jgi:hypothetical protein
MGDMKGPPPHMDMSTQFCMMETWHAGHLPHQRARGDASVYDMDVGSADRRQRHLDDDAAGLRHSGVGDLP